MMHSKSILPFGAVTIVLVVVTLAYSWWHNDACQTLEEKLGSSYFLRWQTPQLLLITAKKESILVESESKSKACEMMLEKISQLSVSRNATIHE
jgi:hypothetical protein